jgi:hypothetical protein
VSDIVVRLRKCAKAFAASGEFDLINLPVGIFGEAADTIEIMAREIADLKAHLMEKQP